MGEVSIFHSETIDEVKWEAYKEGFKVRDYIVPFMKNHSSSYIKNVETKVGLIAIDNVLIPFTVNEKEYDNSYVCSPYNHYITYAKEEVSMLKQPLLESILKGLIHGLGWVTKSIDINKVVYINNWMLSTNLSVLLTHKQIQRIKETMIQHYPQYLICYRSMNTCLYPTMMDHFQTEGFEKLPSRFVYISEPNVLKHAKKKVRNTINRDRKLLDNPQIEMIHHEEFQEKDMERINELYQQLYLDKYSYQNPQFTKEYIQQTYQHHTLHYVGIRINGQLEGVFASKVYQGMMANPIVGYNTSLPKELGMYRMLRYLALNESIKHHRYYHQSAGVGRYKYDRGAMGFPEYTMIFHHHLSVRKRLFWKGFCRLLNTFAVPLVEKKRL